MVKIISGPAAAAAASVTTYVFKSADQTVTNSTSLVSDSHLTFTVDDTSKYFAFWGALYCDGPAAADIKINFNASGNADMDCLVTYVNTGGSFTGEYKNEGNDVAVFTEAAGTEHVPIVFSGNFHSDSSTGDRSFTIHFAQQSANAGDTKMKKGSWIAYAKLED